MIEQDDTERGDDLPMVNRCALVLQPTGVYLAWAKSCPDADIDLTLDELREEGTVYLVPQMETKSDAWLKRNYGKMFEQELYSWCTDERFWPKDRSFEAFQRFFEIQFCSIVLDMGKGPIHTYEY